MKRQRDESKRTPPQFTPLTELAAAKKRVTFAHDKKCDTTDSKNITWKQFILFVIATTISFSIPPHIFRVEDSKILVLIRSIMNSTLCAIIVTKKIPVSINFN